MISQCEYDVFLCHNSKDKPEVIKIQKELEAQGIRTFLDLDNFTVGRNWIDELLEIIDNKIKFAAIFFGCNGLGPIQEREIDRIRHKSFLDKNFRLIPVFLPTATEETVRNIPRSIKEYTWVDLRHGKDPKAMEKLIKAIGVTNILPNITPPDNLSSEKGVDYTRLRDLLKAGKWKEADKETVRVMLKAAGKQPDDYLNPEDIEKFPCTDLRTIDQLWVRYSNGRFGFSVQKRIWESVGQDIYKFGDRVGWRKGILETSINKQWLYYNDLTFSLEAPEGHLPSLFRRWEFWVIFRESCVVSLLSRPDL